MSLDGIYCGDHLADFNVVYFQSVLAALPTQYFDGAASLNSLDTISLSKAEIQGLNPEVVPFVIFRNDNRELSFDPEEYGIEPLSLVAIVCNNQLVSLSGL